MSQIESNMPDPTGAGIVIAFDIDNTLLDADGRAYEQTLSEFLSVTDLGIDPPESVCVYEELRSMGDALARLGFRNPIHDRGNADALAVFCLTRCANPTLLSDLGIQTSEQSLYRELLDQIAAVDRANRHGPFEARLSWEMAARRYCCADPRVGRFREEVQRIAKHPILTEWAEQYPRIERRQPVEDFLPLMQTLASRGLSVVVISEGRSDVQRQKLDRLGLTGFFTGRILITDAAAKVPGLVELDDALSRLIDAAMTSSTPTHDPELSLLWYYRCLIDAWSSKTPSFYGRCLHALCARPDAPQEALNTPAWVPAETWREQSLRFVMVGDRYDKDIEPLVDLLGSQVGLKIRLRQGKYADEHPKENLPADRRPDMTFADWASLASFLTDELSAERINPITKPPDLIPRADIRPDYIKRGLDSPYKAVRTIATAVAAMIE